MKNKVLLTLFLLLFQAALYGQQYYVATNGDDANPGTFEQPFATIDFGISQLSSGDSLTIRGGVYREGITNLDVSNVTIEAYGQEYVEINGLKELTGTWINDGNGIWKINVGTEVTGVDPDFLKNCFQVFIDRKPLVDAQFPNVDAEDIFTRNAWSRADQGSAIDALIDADIAGQFTAAEVEGAIVQLNVLHQYFTWSRRVDNFNPSTGQIDYLLSNTMEQRFLTGNYWTHPDRYADDYYYLVGKKAFLDYPGEYFYDTLSHDLFVYPPAGVDLNSADVEIRYHPFGMKGKLNNSTVKNLTFFGTAFEFTGQSVNHVIDGCALRYPNYTRWIFEGNAVPHPYPNARIAPKVVGRDFTIKNMYMAHAWGAGFAASSASGNTHSRVDNCIIHDAGTSGSLREKGLTIFVVSGVGEANRVTLFNTGNVGMDLLGDKNGGGHFLSQYNHLYNNGLLSHDVTSMYTAGSRSYKGRMTHNWIHDNHAELGAIAIRADEDGAEGLTVDHNVMWNIGNTPASINGMKGIIVKGQNHQVYNNTTFNVQNNDIVIRQSYSGENADTYVYNNLTKEFTSKAEVNRAVTNIRGFEGNYEYPGPVPLIDAANRDFRPQPNNSNLIGDTLPTDGLIPVELDSDNPYVGAYSSDGPAWTAGAENYLRYSVVKDTNGDFVLTARYILPLLEEQKLLLRVNGVSVGDSIIISPEASFGMLTFVIPGSQVNETGPNNLIFGSTGGVTTVNPSYVVSVVETVTKEGYTPSPIIYQGVDETAGEDWRTTSLKPYSISANNAYGMLGYIAWATGNTKDYNGSDINADNPIVSLPNGVTVTANGANQSYSAGYPLFNDPSETPDAVVTTINSGLIYRKDSLASTWRSMVDIQFGQTLTNTVRIGIIQNAGGDKLTGIRLSKAGDPTIYDEKLGLDTKNPSQIRYFAFDVTEIDSGDVFTVSLMGEDSNGDQLTTVGMSGLFFDVMDPIAPVISPVVNANVNVNEANSWMAPTTTATDNFYGDISSDIAISYSSADTGSNVIDLASARQHLGTVGNTVTATYNVTDASGNAATAVSATFTSVSEIYYQGVDETAGTDWRTTSLKPYSISSNNAYGMLGYIAWATGGNIDYNGSDINADHPIISLPNGITVTANGADESYSAGYPLFNDPSQAPGTTVSDINSGLIYRKDIQGGVWRSMVNINVGNTLGDNIRVGIIQNSGGDRLTGVRLSKVGSPSIYDEVTGLDTKNPSQLRYFVFDVAKMEAGDAFTISLMGEDSNGDQQTVVGMSGIFFDIPAGNVSAFSEYPEPVSALVPVSEVEPEARDGEMLISDLVLYPNPSTGVINIKSNEVLRRITIINTVGQLMLLRSTDENKIELNVERLPSGYYSVLMETESGKLITRRFIKE